MDRRPAARFAFEVDVAHSRYTLGTAKLVVGYDGILEIDGETGEVLHLEHVAEHIPKQLSFSRAAATVDYSLTDINGMKCLLPSRSSMELHGPDQWQRNIIDFRDYGMFSADSTIDFAK
jgi:hypothetical protein